MRRRDFLSSSVGVGVVGSCGRGLLLSAVGGAGVASRSATAQASIPVNTWVRRASPIYPAGPQGPNKHVKATYRSADRKVYFVGGDYNVGGIVNGASHEMVYRYDVATDKWENVLDYTTSATAGFPEGRCAPGWTYDPKRDVMWMGMGQNRQIPPRPGLVRGGLWSFDPKVGAASYWKMEGPDVPNPYSVGSSKIPANPGSDVLYMQYDPTTDALYALYQAGGRYLARYDLSGATIRNGVSKDNWSHTNVAAPDYFLGEMSFTVDTKRGKLICYFAWPGRTPTAPAYDRGETWEYTTSTNTWTKLSDTVLPPRSCFGMVYDSASDKVALVCGYDSHEQGGDIAIPLNDVWVFDRNPASPDYHKWMRLTTAGTPPSTRKGEGAVYDAYNNVIVMFGGRGWDNEPDASDVYLLRLGNVIRPAAPTGLQVQ